MVKKERTDKRENNFKLSENILTKQEKGSTITSTTKEKQLFKKLGGQSNEIIIGHQINKEREVI